MRPAQTERLQLIKWTLFLIAFTSTLLFAVVALVVFVLVTTKGLNTNGLLFISACGLGFGFWMLQTRKGLVNGADWAWSSATIIALMSVPSLALPFAILSLIELLNDSNRAAFFRTYDRPSLSMMAEQTFAQPPSMSSKKWAAVATAVAIGLIGFGIKIGLRYQRLVGASESPKAAEYRIDPKLTLPELARLGASCNSEGNMACSLAVYQRILVLDPSDMVALANLAMAESRSGSHPEGIKHFQMYFAQGGRAVDAMFYMAKSLNAQGEKAQALEWCNRALAAAPNLVDVAEFSTRLMLQLGRHAEAAAFIDTFTTKFPEAKRYFDGLKTEVESRSKPATSMTI